MNLSNSVFISYRRNVSGTLALAVYQDLHYNQMDVFYDITSLDAGQFDSAILRQIAARPYFLPILTPGTLERCQESGDWVLREIEEALRLNRMILPLYTPEFNFGDMDSYLPPDVARELKRFQAVEIPYKYFQQTMQDIRTRYLKPIKRPTTPTPSSDSSFFDRKQALAQVQPQVNAALLSAQEYFQRALARSKSDADGRIADYTEALRLNPQYVHAYYNRGIAHYSRGNLDEAIADYSETIRLHPQYVDSFYNRGNALYDKGDLDGAIADYTQVLRLDPQYAIAYNNRGNALYDKGDLDGAIADYAQAIQLNPQYSVSFYNRGNALDDKGDLDGAIADYSQAIQLNPQYIGAYLNRGVAYERKQEIKKAAADFRRVLELRPDHPQAQAMREFIKKHG